MNGTVQQVASVPEAFARLVAERLAAPRDGGFSLFLSGGGTARQCYEQLAAAERGRSTGPPSTSTWATSGASHPTMPTPITA